MKHHLNTALGIVLYLIVVVLLNAAATLSLDGNEWQTSLANAEKAIDSGAALRNLEQWIALTNSFD